jgi:threonine dehydrogenase-like Zn-dependent dehydrogenase
VDLDDLKLERAKKVGAGAVINTAREDLHRTLQQICPGGPDVCIEAIGLPQTFKAAVNEVSFTGRVVYIGYAKEPVPYETKQFVQKEVDIRGSRNALPEDFAAVIKMMEGGDFPVEALITRTFPLNQAPEALALWDQNPALVTKFLVEMG